MDRCVTVLQMLSFPITHQFSFNALVTASTQHGVELHPVHLLLDLPGVGGQHPVDLLGGGALEDQAVGLDPAAGEHPVADEPVAHTGKDRDLPQAAGKLETGGGDPSGAQTAETTVYVGGQDRPARIYDRDKLRTGDRINGPAIVTEMDSTTLVESGCTATIDKVGNILINPEVEG